jgi:hypothetical protein
MRWICFLVGVLMMAGGAEATVLVSADLGELARDARAIVKGHVVAVQARWTEGRRTIETLVTIETESYLKGSLGETVQFRVPGGVLGRFRNVVVGAPHFREGERIIVFLGARGPSVPFILGLNQGLYRLATSAAGEVVTPPPLVPGTTPAARGSQRLRPAPLTEFEADVRRLAGGAH